MHFCYGLGAFISPMIAAPFTLDVECSQPVNGKVTLDTFEPTTNSSGAVVPTQVTVSRAQHLSHSESAFFILASIQVSLHGYSLDILCKMPDLKKIYSVRYMYMKTSSKHTASLPSMYVF